MINENKPSDENTECNIVDDPVFAGYKKMPVPQGCDDCKTPLAECKGLEDPDMDGIHLFEGRWLCDSCLQCLGRIEKGLE
jgi:hypothetical protein